MGSRTRLKWTVAVLVLLGLGFAMFMNSWPTNAQNQPPPRTRIAEPAEQPRRTVPAVDIKFDGGRAMSYLKQICDLGPRISGTASYQKQVELLQKHFTQLGATVELQKFTAKQRSQPKPTDMVNVIARWHPDRPRRVIICTHIDTRPIADKEDNRSDWTKPFLGANDGASGAALMMELAHHMKTLDFTVGVDFVMFDGEEYIFDNRHSSEGGDVYFFGSEHFADTYVDARKKDRTQPVYLAAVLMDMVGGKNPQFLYEGHSYFEAGRLTEELWRTAAELKCRAFVQSVGHYVLDDHRALLRVGIPAVDIIPVMDKNQSGMLSYPHWHKLSDTPENCAPEGMEQVARVLAVWIQRMR